MKYGVLGVAGSLAAGAASYAASNMVSDRSVRNAVAAAGGGTLFLSFFLFFF
jgi:hypothetical protein